MDDDFLVLKKSSRRKRSGAQQKLLEESQDSEGPQSKRTKPAAHYHQSGDGKNKRLSRDEKLFNRAIEQVLVESVSAQQEHSSDVSSSSGHSTGQSQQESSDDRNTSDYQPGHHQPSDSDEDFEPFLPTKNTKNSMSFKKTKKTANKDITKSLVRVSDDCRPSIHVKCTESTTDLPGNKPLSGNLPGGEPSSGNLPRGNPSSGNLPGGEPSSGNLPRGNQSSGDLPGGKPSNDLPRNNTSLGDPKPSLSAGSKRNCRKWVPPATVKGGPLTNEPRNTCREQGRSPGAPTIRVGLSRKAHVKSLHQITNKN